MRINRSAGSPQGYWREASARAFQRTFKEIAPVAKQLVMDDLNKSDQHLIGMVEFALDSQTQSEYPFIFKYSFCTREQEARTVRKLAAAIHLFQSSTFITDDIFDSTAMRYHVDSFHRRYDVKYAIIAAELFQSVAMKAVCSELERGRFRNRVLALATFNEVVKNIYLGQYLDLYNGQEVRVSLRDYYRMIGLTSGSVFRDVARFGALIGDKSKSQIESLGEFGFYYGMGLQIFDDVVDVTWRPSSTGKSYASDLKRRRMRLPILQALLRSSGKDAKILREFLTNKRSTVPLRQVVDLIEKSNALEVCKGIARRYIKRSLKSLGSMESTLSLQNLKWLSEMLLGASV